MIKKLLICLGLGLVPLVAMAAYNDVSLATNTVISIQDSLGNTVSLTVSGTADVLESIIVGSTDFTATLQSGSTLTVVSSGRNLLSTTANSTYYSTSCDDSQSSMTLSSTEAATVVVTASPNSCGSSSTSTATGSNGPVAQSGGGGGGSSSYIAPTTTTTTTSSVASLQAQIASLLAQVASLQAQLGVSSGSGTGFTFGKAVSFMASSLDIKNLQKVLNSDPATRVASSGVGSSGKETTYFGPATRAAVQKFQVKYSLATPGGVGYGVFGPKTRAKAAEVSKMKGL